MVAFSFQLNSLHGSLHARPIPLHRDLSPNPTPQEKQVKYFVTGRASASAVEDEWVVCGREATVGRLYLVYIKRTDAYLQRLVLQNKGRSRPFQRHVQRRQGSFLRCFYTECFEMYAVIKYRQEIFSTHAGNTPPPQLHRPRCTPHVWGT